MISIGASKRWPYSASCARVEALLQLLDPGVVDGSGRHLRAHLVALPGVAAVGEPPDEAAILGHAVRLELCDGLPDELVEARREPRLVEALQRVALGRDELVLEVGREQPGRRDDARVRRHEHACDLELERDVAREHRPAAARGDERELARVVAAAHRVQLDRLGHAVLLDLERAERRLLDGHPELVGDALHRLLGERAVELHAAAEQAAVRAQAAEQELGVGRGRLRAAAPVAGRARVGARRLRADAEHAALVDVARSSRRPRRSCRCRPSAPSPGSRRSSCRAGGASAAGRPRRRRCPPTCRRCRA